MRLLREVRNLMGSYHVKSGIYHYYRNEFKQAVDFFTKALKDEPTLGESDRRAARYYLTQTYIQSAEKLAGAGDLEGAMAEYEAAHALQPDNPELAFWHGVTLAANGREAEGRELLERAYADRDGWRELLRRLPAAGLFPNDAELVARLTS